MSGLFSMSGVSGVSSVLITHGVSNTMFSVLYLECPMLGVFSVQCLESLVSGMSSVQCPVNDVSSVKVYNAQ